MSPSHLDVVFNIAEQFPYPNKVYDVRWPAVESVFNHPSRPSFEKVIFSSTMKKSDYLRKKVDESAMERSGSFLAFFEMIKEIFGTLYVPCSFQDKLPSEIKEPSVALIDPFSYSCVIAVARKHNAKIIYVSPLIESSMLQALSGSPMPESYVMSLLQAAPQMTFIQRIINVFANGFFKLFLHSLPLAKLYFEDENNLYSLPDESLVLANNHKFFELPIPRTNAFMDIGNFNWKPTGELSQDVQDFMQRYDQVILLSFSTYSNDGKLPPKLYSIFVKAFKRFPKIGFIWRQKEELDINPKNVLLVPWINQRAFLSHPKSKALITHGGLNSVLEALNTGIPMIAIPTMGDQFPNAERIRRLSIGMVLSLHSLTEESMIDALTNILKPESIYAKKAKKVKEMLEYERNQNISTNVSRAFEKFVNVSTNDFKRFFIPRGNCFRWIKYFLLEWYCILIIGITIILC